MSKKKPGFFQRFKDAEAQEKKMHPNRNKVYKQIWKGRIPRFFLLLLTVLALISILRGIHNKGDLFSLSIPRWEFQSDGRFAVSLVAYILLTLIAIRANFKCQKISCPSIFCVVLLLGYYSYPLPLILWGIILFCIAFYIIIRTIVSYVRVSKDFTSEDPYQEVEKTSD